MALRETRCEAPPSEETLGFFVALVSGLYVLRPGRVELRQLRIELGAFSLVEVSGPRVLSSVFWSVSLVPESLPPQAASARGAEHET